MTDPAASAVPFVPRRGLRHGHAMTLFAWARTRSLPLPSPEARLIRVSPDSHVLAHCFWQSDRRHHPTLVALHGLEASSHVHYMQGLAAKGRQAGWNVVLLNQRNCGGTEHLTPGLYHSGLTDDPRSVIRSLAREEGLPVFAVAGYSLGGNLAIKLAGELDDHPDVPVVGVAAVCPTIDLERCVRAIERTVNVVYHFNFVRHLRSRMRRKAHTWPGAFDLSPLRSIWTIRRFDDVYTAPHHGFAGASDYYARASALRVAARIRVPTLIVASSDDPVVPSAQFQTDPIRTNPHITLRLERYGGHCGFIGAASETTDGYWAEDLVLRFLADVIEARDRAPRAAP